MRAVGVHEDVIVVTSRIWQTTCTAVRGPREGDGAPEAFVIDSPVLPDELELLSAVLEQADFDVVGLLATHADWDHLLGRLAFPEAPLGCGDSTADRLQASPGEAQRELRSFDESFYLRRSRPLSLGSVQRLPVPGGLEVGSGELELYGAEGHTADGTAVWIPWASVLVAGDYLSPVEIPTLMDGGSLDGYEATLGRLAPLAAKAAAVIPGHGEILDSQTAVRVLDEDRAYLSALRERGARAALPNGRDAPHQRGIHAANAKRVAG